MRIKSPTMSHALVLAAACAGSSAPAAATPAGDSATVPITWQHQRAEFNYLGHTVLYSCDGLEDQVRRILLYFGARSDLKVSAVGCTRGAEGPTRHAWVNADFDLPVPAVGAGAGTPVRAQWAEVKLTPRQPNFMSKDDCELIDSMKDLVTHHLQLRGLEYRTNCFPGSLSEDGFAVTAQALKVAEPKSAQVRR